MPTFSSNNRFYEPFSRTFLKFLQKKSFQEGDFTFWKLKGSFSPQFCDLLYSRSADPIASKLWRSYWSYMIIRSSEFGAWIWSRKKFRIIARFSLKSGPKSKFRSDLRSLDHVLLKYDQNFDFERLFKTNLAIYRKRQSANIWSWEGSHDTGHP